MGCSRGVPGLFRGVPGCSGGCSGDVPGCSGGVPGCSGVFRVLQTPHFYTPQNVNPNKKHSCAKKVFTTTTN